MKKRKSKLIVELDSEKYLKHLNENPDTTLEIDPRNLYNMSDEQKSFIRSYIEFKSIPLAAEIVGIDLNKAKSYFVAYSTQNEIRRINSALCKIQFAEKMMTLEDIGGYLTSLILDSNVPVADQLKIGDKLKVIKLLIELHAFKSETISDPKMLYEADVEADIKELSITTIKQLIYNNENKYNKTDLINELNLNNSLNPEEIEYLKTLSTKDLLQLIEMNNKENENESTK